MREPINCFVLAAGLGERLRPVTDVIPKPLLPVLGKPVLQSVFERLSGLPANKIGVNLHYRREFIEEWIQRSDFRERIVLFPEEPILDTGGALKNAESFLRESTFLVHNSDILSDIDLGRLVEFHSSSKNLATLAVHDYPKFNNVMVDREGLLRGVGNNCISNEAERRVAFTGIAVYSPEFLKFLPEGKSSVVDAWLRAAAAGCRVGTLDVSGCFWSDIGTPAAYASTVLRILRSEGESVYIHPEARGCAKAGLDGYVVIERGSVLGGNRHGLWLTEEHNNITLPFIPSPLRTQADSSRRKGRGIQRVPSPLGGEGEGEGYFRQDVSLRNCIMLPGSRIERGAYENRIIGPGFDIELSESEMGLPVEDGALLIGTGGSDRKYFRVYRDGKTAVLMRCAEGDTDFERHIEYTRFFGRYGFPVPQLIEVAPGKMTALFEDLGDMSLYSWLKCPRDEEGVEDTYKRVLDTLALLHTKVTGRVKECPLLAERIFDYDHLRWETRYFLERFVAAIGNIEIGDAQALQDEFHRLALSVDSFRKTIVHRDFQSQNIMVTKGVPRVIDYQGARIGPPAYDVASILWDPYYEIEDAMQERLLEYYVGEINDAAGDVFDEQEFRRSLLPCRLQRHMQALGAYGFLSAAKGKKYFLKHVPEALRMLKEETVLARHEYPELCRLVSGL